MFVLFVLIVSFAIVFVPTIMALQVGVGFGWWEPFLPIDFLNTPIVSILLLLYFLIKMAKLIIIFVTGGLFETIWAVISPINLIKEYIEDIDFFEFIYDLSFYMSQRNAGLIKNILELIVKTILIFYILSSNYKLSWQESIYLLISIITIVAIINHDLGIRLRGQKNILLSIVRGNIMKMVQLATGVLILLTILFEDFAWVWSVCLVILYIFFSLALRMIPGMGSAAFLIYSKELKTHIYEDIADCKVKRRKHTIISWASICIIGVVLFIAIVDDTDQLHAEAEDAGAVATTYIEPHDEDLEEAMDEEEIAAYFLERLEELDVYKLLDLQLIGEFYLNEEGHITTLVRGAPKGNPIQSMPLGEHSYNPEADAFYREHPTQGFLQ